MNESITTKIIYSTENYFVIQATLKKDIDTSVSSNHYEYTSIGSSSSPIDAENLAIKRVKKLYKQSI